MFSVGWGGGEAPVGVAVKPPAALMDRAMVGSADQGQVVQVGGAAMEPMSEMVGFAPGRGPLAAGDGTAAVADDQGGALGGGDDPAGPADLQRLGRGPTQGRGSRLAAVWSQAAKPPSPPPSWPAWSRSSAGVVVVVGGVAGDQDPGDGTITGQPPARLGTQRPCPASITAQGARPVQQAVQVHGDQQLGPDPTRSGGAGRLPGCGGPTRPGRRPGVGRRSGRRGRRRGGPTVPGRPAGSGRPRPPAAPGPRPCPPRWRPTTTPAAGGAARPGPRRPRGRQPSTDGRRPGAAGAGPAAGPRPAGPVRPRRRGGRGGRWVPWASTWAWAGDSSPSVRAWAVPVRGPPNRARAVRTALLAAPAPIRSRVRSQPAVEPACRPCSAPAAPRASTAASSLSHWPSMRSASPRRTMTRSARAASGSRSRSWAASPSRSAVSAASQSGRLTRMCVRVHDRNLSTPPPNTSTKPNLGINVRSAPTSSVTTDPTNPGGVGGS